MKAAFIRRYGGPEVVEVGEQPRPVPGPQDLLVEVKAASVNPVDFKIREGKVKVLINYPLPLILGNDLSGVVVEKGSGVTRFQVGDAIYSRLDKTRIGTFAQYALVSETAAAPKPKNLTHVEAASIPLVGLTSWQALRELGKLSAGQKVLIHAGSGGVGTFAIQLAHHLGATVATTVSERNVALVRSLGADVVVDYKKQRFEDVVKDQDVVYDTQGGETLLRSFRVVRPGGVVVTVAGVPDANFARAWGLNPALQLALRFMSRHQTRAARAAGAHFEYLFMRASADQLREIGALLEAGTLKPVIDRTFTLDQVQEALAYSEAGRAVGKVVITL